jgi:hypothetical protein
MWHIPSGEANGDDHEGGDGHDDQVSDLEKKKEKIKWAQGKGEIHRDILFW